MVSEDDGASAASAATRPAATPNNLNPPSTTKQTTYSLIIAQFAISGHPRRTEHWNFIVTLPNQEALVFELAGNIDTYTFIKRGMSSFSPETHDYRGGFLLCDIPHDKLKLLEHILSTVVVLRNSTEYDCQTWVALGVRKLQDEGLVARNLTENTIREELEKEKERWEVADDTLVERLGV